MADRSLPLMDDDSLLINRRKQEDAQMIEEMFASCGFNAAELEASLEGERDVLGSSQVTAVNRERVSSASAKNGLATAIKDLPAERTEAYRFVEQTSPHLIDLESPSEAFLAFTNCNYWQAAEKIVDYWSYRRKLYGAARFARPMNLTGEGALATDIVDGMKCGGYMILPPDKFGRPVYLVDRKFHAKRANDDVHFRDQMNFFMLQTLLDCQAAIEKGYVVVYAWREEDLKISRKGGGSVVKQISDAIIPLKCKAFHVLFPWEETFWRHITKQFVRGWIKIKSFGVRNRLHYITPEQSANMIDNLRPFGFQRTHLPERFGGDATYHSWYNWRRGIESERYVEREDKLKAKGDKKSAATISLSTEARELKERARAERIDAILHEVWVYNKNSIESRLLRETEKTVQALQQERQLLLRRQSFIQAQIDIANYLASQVRQDMTQIEAYISEFLPSIPGISSELLTDESRRNQLAVAMVQKHIIYGGRKGATGEWILSPPINLTIEQLSFSKILINCLGVRRLQSLIWNEDGQSSYAAQAVPGNLSQSTDSDHMFTIDAQSKANALKRKKEQLLQTKTFLEASLTCTSFLSEEWDQFQLFNLKLLESSYASLFTSITGVSSSCLIGSFRPDRVAKRFLESHSQYTGHGFSNAVVDRQATLYEVFSDEITEARLESRSTLNEHTLNRVLSIFSGVTDEQSDPYHALQEEVERVKDDVVTEESEQRLEELRRENRAKRRRLLKRL